MSEPPTLTWRDSPAARFGVVILAAVVAALLVYFFLIKDDDDGGSGDQVAGADLSAGAGPVEVGEADLQKLGGKIDTPVFWAGDQGQAALELTRTTDDRVFIRYLDKEGQIGSEEPDFLTVGTYPLKNAYDLLQKSASESGAVVEDAPNEGLVVTSEDAPTSVYIAYPDEDFQIEVYDPDPDHALDLAASGQVEPVD